MYLLLKKCYLCGHSTKGLKLWLYQDILPVRQFFNQGFRLFSCQKVSTTEMFTWILL